MPPPAKQGVDFLVIGAQKTGTTSLFEYLRAHPSVHIPPAKEVPFFSHQGVYATYGGSLQRYVGELFAQAPAENAWGTVTPSYMAGSLVPESVSASEREELLAGPSPETIIPERIWAAQPQVKLVAILRDPIDRARSSHQMHVFRGLEQRSFDQAVEDCLEPAALERARRIPLRPDSYVVFGEYGRILKGYFDTFPREQIRVLFTSELEADPERTVAGLFEYLGVDATFVPPNLGRRYLVGSSKRRIRWLDLDGLQRAARDSPRLKASWRQFPPGVRARALNYYAQASLRTLMWNRVPEEAMNDRPLSTQTRNALARHYAADGAVLEKLVGRRPPWLPTDVGAAPSPESRPSR